MTSTGLARWLATWDDDRLADLVAARLGRVARLAGSFDELAVLLSHPGSCEPALTSLDRTAVQVLGRLAGSGAPLDADALAGQLAADPGVVQQALDRAAALALAWPVEGGWRAPDAVRAVVGSAQAAFEGPPEPVAPEPARSVGAEDQAACAAAQASGAAAQASGAAALRLVSRARQLLVLLSPAPRPLAAGGLGVQVLRRLARAARLSADELALRLQLLAAAGLVGSGPQAGAVTPAGRRWLDLPEEHAYAALVVPQLHPRAVIEPPGTAPSGLLLGVARSGHHLPSVRQVAEVACARGPETDASLLAHLDWSAWRRGDPASRLADWRLPLHVLDQLALRAGGVPAPWLEAALAVEPLGLLEADAAGEVAAVAAVVASHLPPAQDDIVLQADGTAVVAGRPSDALRGLLGLLAARESDHTWRVSADGVRAALDAGRTGTDLLAELRERSRHELPDVLERLVLDVARDHGRIRVRATETVLSVEDPLLVVELLHDRRLAALQLVELGPGVLTARGSPGRVVQALRAAGHAPVGDGAEPPPAPPPAPVRVARPRVQQREWGHDAAEVVAVLRAEQARRAASLAAPPSEPPLWPPPPAPPVDRWRLAGRLSQLSTRERHLLTRAVAARDPVQIDYVDGTGMPTTRVVEGLQDTGHLLEGWCRLRGAERSFDPGGIVGARPAPR